MLLAMLPVAPGFVPVDLNIAVLFVFAISTGTVLSVFMSGWASRNKFSLLGAMRGVAQVVSYEVPMVLSVVAVVMMAGTLSTAGLVEAQEGGLLSISNWYVFRPWGFVGFVLFTLGAMAESARTPFDIPEAESEIIAGYHTEYSGRSEECSRWVSISPRWRWPGFRRRFSWAVTTGPASASRTSDR